jgi:3,4-dihydroxy 2-butanone 4-phosphate synthase/GTP cyclohydrolase II
MFSTIEEALEDLKGGKLIVVMDDEDRENEGDLVGIAQVITHDSLNFMVSHGRGLICVPLSANQAQRLNLEPMVHNNQDAFRTAFTVSVDAKKDITTGISIVERLRTIQSLASSHSAPDDFSRPGHIFPLIAKDSGVLARAGHTEAAVDLAKMAQLGETGVICEILNNDGTMARQPNLRLFCQKHSLKIITIKDLVHYRKTNELLAQVATQTLLPTQYGEFQLLVYTHPVDKAEHIALVKGVVKGKENVLIRVHSECFTGDVLSSLKCDCGDQLAQALNEIAGAEAGVVLYLRQEGRGIGLTNKIKAYALQNQGLDTVDANLALGFAEDGRDYYMASQMLKSLGVQSIELMTNNPSKIEGLKSYGINVNQRIAIEIASNITNYAYLQTKKLRMNHILKL